ncbi:hypothetical protein Sgleb_30910 [Streptomyces glebosus]|uniref:Uncharacterized protein n=1 Tax=Streptomyces glebosus TaxID=249580 RepID=A0A640SW48_9ACTN|nr:hypothetical protein Sgleb_30910 [Streptomyces glebosus]GHG61248.1 hypothetical protein GCM10010513_27210 [Streptomyces glebosus]
MRSDLRKHPEAGRRAAAPAAPTPLQAGQPPAPPPQDAPPDRAVRTTLTSTELEVTEWRAVAHLRSTLQGQSGVGRSNRAGRGWRATRLARLPAAPRHPAYRTTAISRAVWFRRRPPDSVHVTMSSIRTPKRPGR